MTGNTDTGGVPHDPAFEKVRRKMVRLLAISIAVLFVGLIAVLSAVVYRTSDVEESARATGTLTPITVATGAQIVGSDLDGDSALLTISQPDGGQELLLIDLRTGSVVSRFPVQAGGTAASTPAGN